MLCSFLFFTLVSVQAYRPSPMYPLVHSHYGYNTYGTVTSKSHYSPRYAAWEAFSDIAGTYWVSGVYDSPTWIAYEFKGTRKVRAYQFYFANGRHLRTRAPKNFQLQVRRGSWWQTVDERCCETNWAGSEKRFYYLPRAVIGSHFRIMFYDDNDSRTRSKIIVISMKRIQFWGSYA